VKGASVQAKEASKEGFIAHLLLLGIGELWDILFLLLFLELLILERL
jgi:hypothetical protein